MPTKVTRLLVLAVLVGVCPAAAAQATRPATEPAGPREKTVTTRHSILIEGHPLNYAATAGFLPIHNEEGKLQATLFYVAYAKEGQDVRSRPVTFAFNGGPGAASLWLHLGALGPRRVPLADDGKALPAAVRLVDNAYTWLDFTDLVFIDPVGTGYSTAAAGIEAKDFYGVQADVRSVGEFIRVYISQEGRWLSPIYLAGESYGTTRAAALAKHLQDRIGMNPSGLVLISSALNFQPISFGHGNDLPYMLFLPSYAAVTWYHRQENGGPQTDLEGLLGRAEEFALDGYARALAMGDSLGQQQRKETVDALAEFTGLPREYIERADLRISNAEFAKQVLHRRGLIVGLLDGRVTGLPTEATAQHLEYDPSLFVVEGPFTAAIQDYLRRDLGFVTTRRYVFLSQAANESWDWGPGGRGFLNTGRQLQEAMTQNPRLRVLGAAGIFDLTCGYFAQKYMFNHLHLAPPLRDHVRFIAYPAGHQIYTHEPSLRKLQADVAAFMK